ARVCQGRQRRLLFPKCAEVQDEVRDARLQRQGEPRRRPHVANRLRAKGAKRRRRGKDRRAREESGELRLGSHWTQPNAGSSAGMRPSGLRERAPSCASESQPRLAFDGAPAISERRTSNSTAFLDGGFVLKRVTAGDPRQTRAGNKPKVPKVYEAHRTNLDALRRSPLDWSMLCLGPMIASENGKPTGDLRLSVDEWPMTRPAYTYVLPRLALAFAFKQKVPELTISYEDAAEVMLDNLSKSGRFSRRRVGVALPPGLRNYKDDLPR